MKMPIIMILRMIIILCIVTTNCADHIRLDDMTILSVFFINHHNLSPTPSHVGKLCCSSYTGQRDICVFISTGCIAFHKPRMEWNYFDSSWTPQEQKRFTTVQQVVCWDAQTFDFQWNFLHFHAQRCPRITCLATTSIWRHCARVIRINRDDSWRGNSMRGDVEAPRRSWYGPSLKKKRDLHWYPKKNGWHMAKFHHPIPQISPVHWPFSPYVGTLVSFGRALVLAGDGDPCLPLRSLRLQAPWIKWYRRCPKMGVLVPRNGWFRVDNPMNMDDLRVPQF